MKRRGKHFNKRSKAKNRLIRYLKEEQLKELKKVLSSEEPNKERLKTLAHQVSVLAIHDEDIEILEYLMSKDLQPDASGGLEMIPELPNFYVMDNEVLKITLQFMGTQNFKTCPEFFPFLQQLVQSGKTEILEWLLTGGVYPFSSSLENFDMLNLLLENEKMVKFMLEKSCSEDFKDLELVVRHPIEMSIDNNDFKTTKLLLDNASKLNLKKHHVMRAIYRATQINAIDLLQLLHPYVSPIDSSSVDDYFCEPPMSAACRLARVEAAQFLLSVGVGINDICSFKDQWTPLHVACFFYMGHKNLKFMEFLLKSGADVTRVDPDKETPLFKTVAYPELVDLLVSYGAEVNVQNKWNYTPLHLATARSWTAVKGLLDNNADVEIRGPNGLSVYHTAIQYGNNEVLKLLLRCRPNNVNELKDYHRNTLVHQLKRTPNTRDTICKIANTLLFHGAVEGSPNSQRQRSYFQPCRCDRGYCIGVNYFRKMRFLGLEVPPWKRRIEERCQFSIRDPLILDHYGSEVNKMKKIVIGWSPKTTLYDVLLSDSSKMMKLAKNKNLQILYKECEEDFETKFPHFGILLNVRLSEALQRSQRIEQAIEVFEFFIAFRLPEGCGERIFSYLNRYELAVVDKIAAIFDQSDNFETFMKTLRQLKSRDC